MLFPVPTAFLWRGRQAGRWQQFKDWWSDEAETTLKTFSKNMSVLHTACPCVSILPCFFCLCFRFQHVCLRLFFAVFNSVEICDIFHIGPFTHLCSEQPLCVRPVHTLAFKATPMLTNECNRLERRVAVATKCQMAVLFVFVRNARSWIRLNFFAMFGNEGSDRADRPIAVQGELGRARCMLVAVPPICWKTWRRWWSSTWSAWWKLIVTRKALSLSVNSHCVLLW